MTTGSPIEVAIACKACDATGLYVGMAERDGTAVVCCRCHGTGHDTFTYTPFTERQAPPSTVARVHVARGYALSNQHPGCQGGTPITEWKPGQVVPADEQLYCPYLYTNQDWCAQRPGQHHDSPLGAGDWISDCPFWSEKAECWRAYHADPTAPQATE